MIYRIYPSKDSTIYEDSLRRYQNTGKDEILEVGKFYDVLDNTTLLGNSRALVQFDLTTISESIVNGDITSPHYRLRLESTEHKEIQSHTNLYVFPLKESWDEGLGSEADTPHNTDGVSWVYRNTNTTWDVENSTVGKPIDPTTIPSLDAYYDFVGSVGSFELVDTIKGSGGESPKLEISASKMALSASNFGGGTANLSASLESGSIYNIDFDFNRESLSGVEFNVIDPNGYYLSDEIVNFRESLTSTSTYKMAFTASVSGLHKLQFIFFDNNGVNGSQGSVDNFYLYRTNPAHILVYDQFSSNLTTLPTTYVINEGIENEDGFSGSAFVSNGLLFITSSKFGGATLNRTYTLQENSNYTASFDIDYGNFPIINGDTSGSVEFTVMTPDGRLVDENDLTSYTRFITSSQSQTTTLTARQGGEYMFRWSFFGSGSGQYSASLDNIKIESYDHDRDSAQYTDIYYDAHWKKTQGGATWFTASFGSANYYYQSFNKFTNNLDVEVTEYVNEWIDGTRTNNGFIIKKSQTDEESPTKFGSMKFFSSDTNTIYPPVLEVRWDDSTFDTGSLSELTNENIILYVKNLNTAYKQTSKTKIRVYGRDRYPARTFTTTSNYTLVKYLPTTLYYSVVDAETEQVIIPFDTNYTKVSCDSEGNYFNFWFNGLQPERYYRFVFRLDQNGTTKYFDDNFFFKVVR